MFLIKTNLEQMFMLTLIWFKLGYNLLHQPKALLTKMKLNLLFETNFGIIVIHSGRDAHPSSEVYYYHRVWHFTVCQFMPCVLSLGFSHSLRFSSSPTCLCCMRLALELARSRRRC